MVPIVMVVVVFAIPVALVHVPAVRVVVIMGMVPSTRQHTAAAAIHPRAQT